MKRYMSSWTPPLPDSIYQLCYPDWSHDHWDKGIISWSFWISLLGCHDNSSYPLRGPETPTESPRPPQVFNKKEFENIVKDWASRRFQVGGLSVKVGGEQEGKNANTECWAASPVHELYYCWVSSSQLHPGAVRKHLCSSRKGRFHSNLKILNTF